MKKHLNNDLENFNLIITTPDTSSSTSGLSKPGWVVVDISAYSLNNQLQTEVSEKFEVDVASISSPSNFATFSNGGFGEFEQKIISDTVLFSNSLFPNNTYDGIDLSKGADDILKSGTLTPYQKDAIILAISCQDRGYYVVVATTEDQKTFTDFLRKYNISFATVEDIQKLLS